MLSMLTVEKDFYRRAPRSWMLGGVITSSASLDDPLSPQLLRDHIPFVFEGRASRHSEVDDVDVDHLGGSRMVVTRLIQQMWRRSTGSLRTIPGVDWLTRYKLIFREAGLPYDKRLVVEGDFTEIGGYIVRQRLLSANTDVVFECGDYFMSLSTPQALRQANHRVPEDVALVGSDHDPIAA